MAGQRIGYIRVSTVDQQTERQLEGVSLDQTFTDKASGKDTNRPQLEQMLRFARAGDTIIVHSMDRLARNLDDLRRIVQMLTGKGAGATHEIGVVEQAAYKDLFPLKDALPSEPR